MAFTKCDGETGVFLIKLILEELRLIRSEMKEEVRKLAYDMKTCLMHQDNIVKSENVEENVQTQWDLDESVDYVGHNAFYTAEEKFEKVNKDIPQNIRSFTCIDAESDKSCSLLVVKAHDPSCSDLIPKNGCSQKKYEKKGDYSFESHAISADFKQKLVETSGLPHVEVSEPFSLYPSNFISSISETIKYNPSCVQSALENIVVRPEIKDLLPYNEKSPKSFEKFAKLAENYASSSSKALHQNMFIEKQPKKNLKKNEKKTWSKLGVIPIKISSIEKQSQKSTNMHTCPFCSKQFKLKAVLTGHMRTHTEEKRFQCKICLKRFAKRYNLERHFKTHTGVGKFKCEVCSRSYTESWALKRHCKTHREKNP